MKYVTLIETDGTSRKVAAEISGWGQPYQILHDQTDVSGYDCFSCYSSNGFDNNFQKADERIYGERGWCAEIFRDVVEHRDMEKGELSPREGFVPVLYIAHAGLPNEFRHNGWMPRNGLIVPVKKENGSYEFFEKGTLIPKKVVSFDDRETAERAFSEFGLPLNQISGFYRSNEYKGNKRFVGRDFDPGVGGRGRFLVLADRPPGDSGDDWVGARSKIEEHQEIGQIHVGEELAAVNA